MPQIAIFVADWVAGVEHIEGVRALKDVIMRRQHQTLRQAGFRLRRTWTLLDVNLFAGTQRRKRGEISSMNGFFHFGAVRRF